MDVCADIAGTIKVVHATIRPRRRNGDFFIGIVLLVRSGESWGRDSPSGRISNEPCAFLWGLMSDHWDQEGGLAEFEISASEGELIVTLWTAACQYRLQAQSDVGHARWCARTRPLVTLKSLMEPASRWPQPSPKIWRSAPWARVSKRPATPR